MKRQRVLYIILIVILAAALVFCGTVIAYMFRQTEYKKNQFTPAQLSCEVVETFDGTQKSSIQVRNTGNIDAYLRVRLVSYWVDAEGNIIAKPSEMPEFTPAEGWIPGSYDTYYYRVPVAPNELTNNLLSAPITLESGQVVEVFAEAIQSEPNGAVTSSWGVTVGADGNITTVP